MESMTHEIHVHIGRYVGSHVLHIIHNIHTINLHVEKNGQSHSL